MQKTSACGVEADRHAVLHILARYSTTWEDAAADDWARLFAVDGLFETAYGTFRGQEEIVGFARAALQRPEMYGKHLVFNTVLELSSNSCAAISDFLFYRHLGGWAASGRYHDRFVRTDEGWRIAHRHVLPALARA